MCFHELSYHRQHWWVIIIFSWNSQSFLSHIWSSPVFLSSLKSTRLPKLQHWGIKWLPQTVTARLCLLPGMLFSAQLLLPLLCLPCATQSASTEVSHSAWNTSIVYELQGGFQTPSLHVWTVTIFTAWWRVVPFEYVPLVPSLSKCSMKGEY